MAKEYGSNLKGFGLFTGCLLDKLESEVDEDMMFEGLIIQVSDVIGQ
jgi:hypothetical protein